MADEYIRKQDAIDALDRIFDNVPMELTTEILRLRRELRGLPSTDVAPVTHGGWMDAEIVDGDTAFPVQVCTVCSSFFPLAYTGGGHKFCHNCGAKMDSEKKEWKMIRIEDACKVCKDLIVEFGDGTMDAEMEELIHNEMEQKEWVNAKAGPASKILSSITDTIMDIHPVKIAEAIKEDKLRDWCVEMQVSLNMLLVQLPIKHEE